MRLLLLLNLVLEIGVLALPRSASAQAGGIVEGRVYERGTDQGFQGAVVELRGHGAALTASDGSFRFEGVQPGGYSLRVMAFGYAPHDEFLVVRDDDDTVLDIPLAAAAIALDSITVNLRGVDISGRVRDPERDFLLVGAEVLTNQGRASETNPHGRFELESVIEGAPLQVSIRAFGYLPLDTTIVPREDADYLFDLKTDPVGRPWSTYRSGASKSGRHPVSLRSTGT